MQKGSFKMVGDDDNAGAQERVEDPGDESSGVIQFHLRNRDGDTERQNLQVQDGSHGQRQRQSTPQVQNWMRAQPQGDVLQDFPRMEADEYHGDVRPRVYRELEVQGGGDRPEPVRFGRPPVRPQMDYMPDFNRGAPQDYRLTRPLIKPERYDGNEDWNTYLQHFEWVAELNGWREQEKARYLTVSVTGTARQVLAAASHNRMLDYATIVRTLQARFDPLGRLELHRIQLKNRVRQTGESLSTLADDVRRLVDRVFADIPAEARDKLARDSFIDALTDSEMRTRLLQMRTGNIQEVMEAAIELEALTKAEKERGQRRVRELGADNGIQCTNYLELKNEVERLKKQLEEAAIRNSAPRGSNNVRACYNCGDTSHLARDCPKPRRSFRKDDSQKGN